MDDIAILQDSHDLTEAQNKALQTDKAVFVEACAGSGKTTTLVQRYLHILWENPHLEADQILAITYTNKAAAEMKARLQALCQPHAKDDHQVLAFKHRIQSKFHLAQITTIHGFCKHLCTEYPFESGMIPNMHLLNNDEQEHLFLQSIDDHFSTLKRNLDPQLIQLVSEFEETYLRKAIMKSLYQYSRIRAIQSHPNLTEIMQTFLKSLSSDKQKICQESQVLQDALLDLIIGTFQTYETLKKEACVCDFDDLIQAATRLLESPSIRHQIQAHYHYVFVDESQDTNQEQWHLIDHVISDHNPRQSPKLFVVGDRFQSIYSFQESEPELFQALIRSGTDADRHLVSAHDNFRSDPMIIHFVNGLFTRLFQDHKDLQFPTIRPFKLPTDAPSIELAIAEKFPEKQVLFMAQWIQNYVTEKKGSYQDICILSRTKVSLKLIHDALINLGIPCRQHSGTGLYETQEIIDLVNLITALYDTNANRSWAAVLQSPLFGLSDEGLFNLRRLYPDHCVFDAIHDPSQHVSSHHDHFSTLDFQLLQDAKALVRPWVDLLAWTAPDQVCRTIYQERQVWALYASENPDILPSIEKCLDQIQQWHLSQYSRDYSIPELLHHHFKNKKLVGPPNPPADNTVHLMTIHNAKGLEFPVVFLPHLEKKINSTQSDALILSSKHGAALSYKVGKDPNPWRQHLTQTINEEAYLEELRLFYVACTRAKNHLVLCGHRPEKLQKSFLQLLLDHATLIKTNCTNTTPKAIFFSRNSDAIEMPLHDIDLCTPSDKNMSKKTYDHHLPTPPQEITWPKKSYYSLSIADISDILDCPKRFHLKSLIPATTDPVDPLDFSAIVGTTTHDLLATAIQEQYSEPRPIDSLDLKDCPAAAISTVRSHYEHIFNIPFWKDALNASRRETEYPFTFHTSTLSISGRIDLMYELNGALYIVDYKTISRPKRSSISHQNQLSLYYIAMKQQFPNLVIHCGFVYTGSGDYVSLKNPEETANTCLKSLEKRLFVDTPAPLDPNSCLDCPISTLFPNCNTTVMHS